MRRPGSRAASRVSVELGARAKAVASPGVPLSLPWIEEIDAVEVEGKGGVPNDLPEEAKSRIQFQVQFQVAGDGGA